jgi:hypothetical protein
MPCLFTVRGGPQSSITTCRRQLSSKDHDHGSHEEEEEGEEGSEEVVRTFFKIRERLDESPAAFALKAGARPNC